MYSTHTSPVPRAITAPSDAHLRLNWLVRANEQEAARRDAFRNGAEELEMCLMQRPVAPEKAYALFGLLLGALPPAAIFGKLLGYGLDSRAGAGGAEGAFFILCLAMNAVCCLAGYGMGGALSRLAFKAERSPWSRMLLMTMLGGALWGATTGIAGGAWFFGIGALFGAAFAIPIGIVAFVLFALGHRWLERGGMIDARHFLPLACGITATIAALILGS